MNPVFVLISIGTSSSPLLLETEMVVSANGATEEFYTVLSKESTVASIGTTSVVTFVTHTSCSGRSKV